MNTFNRIAVVSAALMALAAPATAAPYWNWTFDALPEGSYQRTCRDISAFNGRLYARCQGAGG